GLCSVRRRQHSSPTTDAETFECSRGPDQTHFRKLHGVAAAAAIAARRVRDHRRLTRGYGNVSDKTNLSISLNRLEFAATSPYHRRTNPLTLQNCLQRS